jgi:hypothetical protein
MSTSATARARTSAERSPENSINPATARSRHERRLSSSADASAGASARGSRRDSRTRNGDRGCGRAKCPSSPSRCPGATRRAAAPVGIGFGTLGSRIARNANNPLTAANRRFTVAAANPSRRASTDASPHAPLEGLALRHEPRNRSSTSASTWSSRRSCPASQRSNASRSNAYPRRVPGA